MGFEFFVAEMADENAISLGKFIYLPVGTKVKEYKTVFIKIYDIFMRSRIYKYDIYNIQM